jgi:hypothetical protein
MLQRDASRCSFTIIIFKNGLEGKEKPQPPNGRLPSFHLVAAPATVAATL